VAAPSAESRAVVERAARLARDKLAPRAAHYDRQAVNPVESWGDLWEAGLLGMTIPTSFGGLGLDMPTYVSVVRVLAQGCASTAMTVHMHSTVMRFIDALGTPAQKRRYYSEVVERGRLFGSWGSEPAVSLSRTFLMETVIRADGDGWIVDGVKHFCTMALGARHYMVWCALDGGADMAKSLLLALVPADSPGVATDGRWDTLGMRATYSPTVTLSGVRVERDAVLGDPGAAVQAGVVESFALGYAAIYVGIAEAALDFAMDYGRKRVVRPDNVPVAHDPTFQRHIGELRVQLDSARLLLDHSAAGWASADAQERGLLGSKAKYLATEASLHVTSRAIQVVGGRGVWRDYPLERAFRDVRTCTLMPPTVDRMLEAVGKSALGLETGMFNVTGAAPDTRPGAS
jgi:alkylation response protein AidB-like acyl-CoA dehydrogenase